jgi:hypothetical protein
LSIKRFNSKIRFWGKDEVTKIAARIRCSAAGQYRLFERFIVLRCRVDWVNVERIYRKIKSSTYRILGA